MLAQKVAEGADMLLQSAIRHEGAISRENFRLRQRDKLAALVHMSENEFTRLYGRARTGGRLYSASFDLRFRDPIAVAEMLVRVVERRNAVKVKR